MKTNILAIIMTLLLLSNIVVPAVSAGAVPKANKDKEIAELISELEETLSELDKLSSVSDEALVVEYIKQELQELKLKVDQLDIDQGIKNSLLVKLDAALKKNDHAMQFVLDGKEKQANNMLKATNNILDAFIKEAEAQRGKKLTEDDANNLIHQAQEIKKGIEEGAQWIIEEKVIVITQEPLILAEIDENIAKLREILAELQALGVEVDVVFEEHSPAVPVLIVAGVKYVLVPAVTSALMTTGIIVVLERSIGPICWNCKLNMYVSGVALSVGFRVGVGLALLKFALELTTLEQTVIAFGGVTGLRGLITIYGVVIGWCDDPNCIFYKEEVVEWD